MGINNMGDARGAQPSMELKCDSGAEAQLPMRLKCMGACDHIRSEQGARRGRICMWKDEVCTGVHEGAWGRFSKIHEACG